MNIVGKTEDGKTVVNGFFKMYDTNGMPMDILLTIMDEKNMVPSWTQFVIDALNAGWKEKTIIHRVSEATTDVFGPEYSDIVIKRIKEILES